MKKHLFLFVIPIIFAMVMTTVVSAAAGDTTRIPELYEFIEGNGESKFAVISADGNYSAFVSDATNLVEGDTNSVQDVFLVDRAAGIITRVSVASDGTQGNGISSYPSISSDGRYIIFSSAATNLVDADTNEAIDIFVHDRNTGETTRISVDSVGTQGDGDSDFPSVSADGRYVAFQSVATNLVSNDTNGFMDVFVHDRNTGETVRVSVGSAGVQANGDSAAASISADGTQVTFQSDATNLVNGDSNNWKDIFVHNLSTGATALVSVASVGTQGNSTSYSPSISANGQYIAFYSVATNLVAGDTNSKQDVFVHDQDTGETTRVSVASDGTQGNDVSSYPIISADGRYVTFYSPATNLVAGDTNGFRDVFVHDRNTGETTRVSVASDGTQGNDHSQNRSFSADGRYVTFSSEADNLVDGDTNGVIDAFIYDQDTGETIRISEYAEPIESNGASINPSVSEDGRYIAFNSYATNLVSGDTNGYADIFVYDRDNVTIKRVSVASDGTQANSGSSSPTISADGLYVVFQSTASNLVSGDTNGSSDIFVYNLEYSTINRVSVDSYGVQGNSNSYFPAISADGRYITYYSYASNLVTGDTNTNADIFVFDRNSGTTTRVSVASDSTQGNNESLYPAISGDGRYVTFQSRASNLVPEDTDTYFDIFVYYIPGGTISCKSTASDGTKGNNDSVYPVISYDGRYIAFQSIASNLVIGDTNNLYDIFIVDRGPSTTTRVSVSTEGTQGNGNSSNPALSWDGRFVIFESIASNLVANDTNNVSDIFVFDRDINTTTRISEASDGTQGNDYSLYPSISSDGSFTAFYSAASSLVAGDENGQIDIFIHEIDTTDWIAPVVSDTSLQSIYSAGISDFTVTFSEDVADPAGNDGTDDVTNPNNYLLVEAGSNSSFDTLSCSGGVQTDDQQITISGVSYSDIIRTATVTLGSTLPEGNYKLFVCGTTSIVDLAGNKLNDGIDEVVTFSIDSTAPIVSSTSLIPFYSSSFANFTVTFSEDVADPAGNDGADDVTNPANYLLVEAGSNSSFDTLSCSGGVQTDDQQVTVSSVSYNDSSFTATVTLESDLSDGSYKLFVCGTTSILDLAGYSLNDGADSAYSFTVDLFSIGDSLRVSVTQNGIEGNGLSINPYISANGDYIVFESDAANLVENDNNGARDIFLKDLSTGEISLISVDSSGVQGDDDSFYPYITADGRYVTYRSAATNLVSGDTNGFEDVFVYDRNTAVTTRVSVDSNGNQGDGNSGYPSISDDGRYVTFDSLSTNLVDDDSNYRQDVFLHDRITGETIRISENSSGVEGNNLSARPIISGNGDYVAFHSDASNLEGDGHIGGILVYNRLTGLITRSSVSTEGVYGYGYDPSISQNGRFVAFYSGSTLVPDKPSGYQIFVHDQFTGETTLISIQGIGNSSYPSISADGRFVSFYSIATNLVVGDTNGYRDAFVHDRQTGETIRISVASDGTQGNNHSQNRSISADGRLVLFSSDATNIVADDTNLSTDVFIHEIDNTDTTAPLIYSTSLLSYYSSGFSEFSVTFSEDVADPAGNDGANDVTNPINYLLVEAGSNTSFDTLSCSGGVQTDDQQMTVNGVSYDDSTYTAAVTLSSSLGDGNYKLFVCGSTSIEDLAGNKLNDGSDEMIEFTVDSTSPTVDSTSLLSSYTTGISDFTVTFSKDVADPSGNDGADDVTNPANYLLVEAGSNTSFDTLSCAGGVQTDDQQMTVNGVSYDDYSYTSTVTLSSSLAEGTYKLFVCGTTSIADLAGNKLNDGVDEIVSFTVDATAPTVDSTSLLSSYTSGISDFTVTFSEDVADPAGNDGADDVTNPTNYLLVEAGSNASFDTLSCAGGVQTDDQQMTVNGVSYDDYSYTSTVTLSSSLGDGNYKLFVCGTTSIADLAGNKLNDGSDATYSFSIDTPVVVGIPTLSNPPNGKVTTYQTLNFVWSAVTGATKYQFQISDDNTFATTLEDTEVATNGYRYGVLPYGDTYSWRVRAGVESDWGDWSDTWEITVNKDTWEPNDTQGTAVGNFDMSTQYQQYVQGYVNSETDQDWFSYYIEDGQCVRFWINMQYRTKSYDSADMQIVIYRPDGGFLRMNNDAGAYNDPAIKICVTETGTYTLRAKLEKGALPVDDADRTYQLMAQWLDIPTLTAPANGGSTSDRTPTFRWGAVYLATIYDIQVATDANFTHLIFQKAVNATTYTPTTNLTNDTYYWRVRARNLRYIGDYSGAWTVTIP